MANSPSSKSSSQSYLFDVGILLFLYFLQGIPLGLCESFPVLLQMKGATLKDLAFFSIVTIPYSLKILWAPIVDSFYIKSVGRRKCWLIPVQIILALSLILISSKINFMLSNVHQSGMMFKISIYFTFLIFLAATQDIVVDGWAISMLPPSKVALASSCNAVGQTVGVIFGNLGFILLRSPDFWNNYYRSEKIDSGLVTDSGFFNFCGYLFLIGTLIIAVIKREDSPNHQRLNSSFEKDKPNENTSSSIKAIWNEYKILYLFASLPPIRSFSFFLLTSRLGSAAIDSLSTFKLIENGVKPEFLSLLTLPTIILQLVMSLYLSATLLMGKSPLVMIYRAMPIKLACCVFFGAVLAIIHLNRDYYTTLSNLPWYIGTFLFVSMLIQQIPNYQIYVSSMAFFAKISDPVYGGSQMTLLNTISNLGSKWPKTVMMYLSDYLTLKTCTTTNINKATSGEKLVEECKTTIDGFYVVSIASLIFGVFWYFKQQPRIAHLSSLSIKQWRINPKSLKKRTSRNDLTSHQSSDEY